MAENGKLVLGTYSASCETIRAALTKITSPQIGDIVFFSGTRHSGANHIAIIYKVGGNMIYTVEGNTSGGSSVIDNGGSVAMKSYSTSNSRILSYGRPNYTTSFTASRVISIAMGEVGYLEKATNANLGSKTLNAGSNNYTKYGDWIGANGNYWCASFISWCFHAAYDGNYISSGDEAILGTPTTGTDYTVTNQIVSNSSLVNYVNRLSTTNAYTRTMNVTRITVHIARTIGDIYDLSELLNSSSKAYNYGIDNSGTIGLFVDESKWTDSSDNKSNDQQAVNIICMNETLAPRYTISTACEESLINLLEDVARRRFLFRLIHDGGSSDTITFHSQFNPMSECPGPYLTSKFSSIMETVNNRISAQYGVNFVSVASTRAKSQADALRVQSTVAIKSIKPYVIAPKPTHLNVNYEALRQLGVVGVMLNAGERFNSNHERVDYRTTTIYQQTLEVKAASLPYAYYYTTHCRSIAELREEAYWFYFVVSKYPPKLGVWLRCQFDVNSTLAQQFVEEWYLFFVDWGLKSKCGLYCTKDQATKIAWPKQKTYMPLWLEGELTDSVCPDDELLTPSFFKLDDLTNWGYKTSTDVLYVAEDTGRYQGTAASDDDSIDTASYKRVQGASYTEITIPSSPHYTGTKKYESYTAITNTSTRNYKITHSMYTETDEHGFRKIDNRYIIAVGSGVCFTIGTYMDVILANGTLIECIMGDGKADAHTDSATHIFTAVNNNYCCTEFIVDTKKLDSTVKKMGDCSYLFGNWKSPVKSIRVYNKNWFG